MPVTHGYLFRLVLNKCLTFENQFSKLANTELLATGQVISFKTPPSSLWWYNFERGFPPLPRSFFCPSKKSWLAGTGG